jgi:hypothetical protein
VQPYLTPERFRTMRTGAVLTGYSSLEIAETIADASAIADAYCNQLADHSFRGGTVLGEEHNWAYPTSHFDAAQRRLFLYHRPILDVTGLRLLVGAGASASIPEASLVIQHSEEWIEVTSLAIASNSGLFGVTGWIVPIGGLANPIAQVDYTYGQSYEETGDIGYPIDDEAGQLTYQFSHGFWALAGDVTVYDGGVEVDPGDYTVSRSIGRVTFASAPSGEVTADYVHEMDGNIPRAVAHITAALIGTSRSHAKGLTGDIHSVKVGEISITRGMKAKEAAGYLDTAVPSAALLLSGHRLMWMA